MKRLNLFALLWVGSLAVAVTALPFNVADAQLKVRQGPKGPNPGKPGKAKFVVEELTTKQFRMDSIGSFTHPELRLLESQWSIAAAISNNTARAEFSDAFPFWEFKMAPGKYRMAFKFADAAWTNKMIVGTVKEKGQPGFDREFGFIDNRGRRGDVVFDLSAVTIVRFEPWTDQPGVGWHKALSRCNSFEEMLTFDNEDGADADFDDLMVYFYKVN